MRAKLAKKINRQAREIASKMPTVTTQCFQFEIKDGRRKPYAVVDVVSNHVRRIRRAVTRNGVEGLRTYLDGIHKLQKERNNELPKETIENQND